MSYHVDALDRPHNAATFALLVSLMVAPLAHATTWTVNNTGDPASGAAANCVGGNASTCELRDAVAAAADGDTIAFDVGSNQTITLTSNTMLTLTADVALTIDGSGSPGLTIDGNNATQVFHLGTSSQPVVIQDLTIAHGNSATRGGAIYTFAGTMTLNRVTIAGSSANQGGAIFLEYGSTMVMDECVVKNNSSADITTGGGGIYVAQSKLTMTRSTLSGNTTTGSGGAMWCEGDVEVDNSTIYGNSASGFEGGGGAHTYGVCTPFNFNNVTFFANSAPQGGPDLYLRNPVTANNTIFGDGCALNAGLIGANNLDAGTSCGQPRGSSNVDLQLGTLQDNGGPTLTVMPGAAAIDRGDDATCAGAAIGGVDQRGLPRPQGVHCDVGAVEVHACYVKFDATGSNDGTSWTNAYTNLQSALANAACVAVEVARGVYKPTATTDRSVSFKIRPGLGVYGGYAGAGSQRDPVVYPTVLSGDIDDNDTGTNSIDTDTTQIVGSNSYHVVVIDGTTGAGKVGPTTILDGFTITGGQADGAGNSAGGGIYCNGSGSSNAACSPRLNDLVFSGNYASNGGALENDGSNNGVASPTVTNATFTGNKAFAFGGAIYDESQSGGGGGTASPTIANATFANNSASFGGAIYNHGYLGTASPAITNATFAGNSASQTNGGAIYNVAVSPYPGQANPVITNAIVWGNTSPEIYNEGAAAPTLDHVVISACPSHSASCTNLIGTDPSLGTLQDNGGDTPTMMPGTGSSAINAGLDSVCTAAPVGGLDQRRIKRPVGAHCDIGAVEATSLSLSVDDGSLFAIYGGSTQYTVTLKNLSATDTVNSVQVTGPGSAALDDAGTLWSCTTGNCTTTQTGGPLNDTATLGPNGQLTWHVTVPVLKNAGDATATLTARSSGATSAGDTDTLALFRGTFESQ